MPVPPRATLREKELPRAARTLYRFLGGLLRTTLLTGGRVMGCVCAGEPEVVAVASWNAPGAAVDRLGVFVRSGMYRAITGGWGLRGLRVRVRPVRRVLALNKYLWTARGGRAGNVHEAARKPVDCARAETRRRVDPRDPRDGSGREGPRHVLMSS